jgi:hypothetical protein
MFVKQLAHYHKKAKSDWIPVTERMPEPYEDVLLVDTSGYIDRGIYHEEVKKWFWTSGIMRPFEATHWQPLPAPPEAT